jgi:hypothetical protein
LYAPINKVVLYLGTEVVSIFFWLRTKVVCFNYVKKILREIYKKIYPPVFLFSQ